MTIINSFINSFLGWFFQGWDSGIWSLRQLAPGRCWRCHTFGPSPRSMRRWHAAPICCLAAASQLSLRKPWGIKIGWKNSTASSSEVIKHVCTRKLDQLIYAFLHSPTTSIRWSARPSAPSHHSKHSVQPSCERKGSRVGWPGNSNSWVFMVDDNYSMIQKMVDMKIGYEPMDI